MATKKYVDFEYLKTHQCYINSCGPLVLFRDIDKAPFITVDDDDDRPETRCYKCSRELACKINGCLYPMTTCKDYHRDAPDGGFYG